MQLRQRRHKDRDAEEFKRGACFVSQVGLSKAVKICQCSEVVITAMRDLPMQVDGEPWGQTKCVIKISRKVDPVSHTPPQQRFLYHSWFG